ncbi:SRA stem-loop-interacting RNA-binding protein, mitochondrial [Halotydeus destructor]|nr:SRA stem-loop-interacting RNA-binding protein, mitochondrial [Halotydeus destructor]
MNASRGAFTVFVRNIPWTVGKRDLAKYSSQYGKVLGVTINYDKNTGMHKGWGFVNFGTKDAMLQMVGDKHFLEGAFLYAAESERY